MGQLTFSRTGYPPCCRVGHICTDGNSSLAKINNKKQ